MEICTIIAANYLPAARVLARSFLEHHPDGRCWTLVIDDLAGHIDAAREPFEVLRPEDLSIDAWEQMRAGYSVLELSTAVKPWLLRHLLEEHGLERVSYFDPDIRFLDSVAEIDKLLREHTVVVTPHLTAPMPRDGRRPTEADILIAGSFNLGFGGFARGDEVEALLDWWAERLETDCVVAPEKGYFVDQRWMDFAPGLVPSLYVLRNPGYNIAYWNLPSREVTKKGESYFVNGEPLRFFHFSGYDPGKPAELSKHQDRIELDQHPVLRELCDDYGRALTAEGHDTWHSIPYGWDLLPDGTRLDYAVRNVYRDAVEAHALREEDIFTESGCRAFTAYLRGPAQQGGGHGVSRYLHAIWSRRTDLREAFPDLMGADGPRIASWACFPSSDVQQTLLTESANGAAGPPAVNVAGYFKGVLGTGEHARQLAAALRAQQIPVTTTTLRPHSAPEDDSLEPASELSPRVKPLFNLLCVNADSTPETARALGRDFFAGRFTIGFWAWEVSAFPVDFLPAFSYLDEVWVGSRHVGDAVGALATIPVTVIPQPISVAPISLSSKPPAELPSGFNFLFAFDYLSIFERKNALATIEAFKRAFPPGSGASLTIKSLNGDSNPSAHERLLAAAATHEDIHLIERRLTASERDGLMNAIDCYVSLHRAEGFGYTLAESMWLGKPVIATAYSGNLDYMSKDNSFLVDYSLVPIGPGLDPYPAGGTWAEPDVDHAAKLMHEVFEHRDEAQRRGERAAADIRASHGPDAAGRAIAERLRVLLSSPAIRSARLGTNGSGAILTDRAADLINSGPTPQPNPRFGAPQQAARKGLLRLLKPVTVHERMIDDELLRAIEALDAQLQSLTGAHAASLREIEQLKGTIAELRNGSGQ